MKRCSIIIGIMTLVLFVSVLVGVSDVVSAQGQRGDHHGKGFWADLTEEQREAVQEKKEEMRSQGATREEIHAAVAELLQGYGIELPEKCRLLGGSEGLRHNRGGFMANLTDEQRQTLREKTKEMQSQGATREEIRAAKAEMLKGYGIELPENWGRRHGLKGLGHGPCDFGANLTEEQRQTLREKTKEMRSQGATREEIREAVAELLEGFGIESPEGSESTSSETAPAELQIQAQSYPNPFNPQTEIAYSLPEDSYVKITVYNVQGQKVTTLVDEHQSAGTKRVIWDGCDEGGGSVASGVYLYRIEAGPHAVTNRMVLLK